MKSFQSTQKSINILSSSFIQTILSALEFHQIMPFGSWATPNHAFRLVGYTTGRELHPALKIVIQLRTIIISDIISVNKKFFSRLSKYNNLQAGKHRLFLNILLFGKLLVIQLRTIIISDIISVNKKFFSRLSKYNNLQAGKHRLFLNILLFGKLQIHIRCYPCILHLYVDILFSTVAQLLLQVAFILCKCTERQHLQHIPLQIHIRCYPCILHLYVDILFSTVAQLLLQVAFILCKCTERQHLQHIPLHQLPLQLSPVILISSYTHDSALLTSLLPPASACFVTVVPFASTYYHI